VQRFTPLLAEAARPCRHRVDDRWWVDETYVKVSGRWRYVYRAIDQFVYVSTRRDSAAARCFFTRALATMRVVPVEVTTDKAAVYTHVLDELAPDAWHCTQAYASNRMEADHGQLKRRLRPMRGLKTDQSARIIIAGHAFIQNIRRGHYELGVDEPVIAGGGRRRRAGPSDLTNPRITRLAASASPSATTPLGTPRCPKATTPPPLPDSTTSNSSTAGSAAASSSAATEPLHPAQQRRLRQLRTRQRRGVRNPAICAQNAANE
jgi:transposase-like protein